ncbi:MAG TPA: hypothetical protein VK695_13995 [Steroidobacteraceae bacterium]|jgi:hypothetical protein|nr:hypothetical protein [Steroidobacteraceae bacterium]
MTVETPMRDPCYWDRELFPHTPLRALAPDLWVVQGSFPAARLPRNMVVYRSAQQALLLHSVVALAEPEMRELEALGELAVMVIPHWDHWAHIAAFKKRYPRIDVVCPRASIDQVSKHIEVEYSCEDYFPRHGVKYHQPPGIRPLEGVLEVPVGAGKVALLMNDLITNVPHQSGFYGLVLRLTRSSGKPRVIYFVRRQLRVQRQPLRAYIAALAQRRDIEIVTTSHGECLLTDVANTLSRVAQDL